LQQKRRVDPWPIKIRDKHANAQVILLNFAIHTLVKRIVF
jgi:hypothetical protein